MDTQPLTPSLWFIPGANASSTSFAYLSEKLKEDPVLAGYEYKMVSYDCQDNLQSIVNTLIKTLPRNRPIILVGHSLGGVIATAATQQVSPNEHQILGVITMGSPLGGSEAAEYLQWMFPHYYLLRNISHKNKFITSMVRRGIAVPTLTLVSSSGNNPLLPEANDGVVTVKSQRAMRNPNTIEVPLNHFEILLSENTVEHIRLFVNRVAEKVN